MSSPPNLLAGWYGFIGGALSGALIGLFFPRKLELRNAASAA